MSVKYQCLKCKLGHYCKFGNFREAFIFAKLRIHTRSFVKIKSLLNGEIILSFTDMVNHVLVANFKRRKYSAGSSSHMSHRK